MPYIITKKNGKRFGGQFVLTATEIDRLRNDRACYTVVNTTTRRTSKVGGACRTRGRFGEGPSAAPSAAAPPAHKPAVPTVAGWWPFGKKKAKPRVGDKTIYWFPGSGGGSPMSRRGHGVMSGARRRRRRRR